MPVQRRHDRMTEGGAAEGGGWRFWIDRGGTFTDIVAVSPSGSLTVRKLLSENPDRYADAAIHGIGEILAEAGGGAIAEVKVGTTVATNALLERAGEPTVLAITAGFADVLTIGVQARPRLFDLAIVLPERLETRTVEIAGRLTADGAVRIPLDLEAARRDLAAAHADGFRSVAIVLMHAWRDPAHERAIAALAREIGFTQVSASHEVSALMKIVARGDTTVADAYLSPPLRRYVRGVAGALGPGAPLALMQSNGGLAPAETFRGRDAILSGPAGGVVGMAQVAAEAGFEKVIGFDMGGTSTDVSHFAGAYERVVGAQVGGVRLQVPMMAIETVAAGGGSICRFDGARLRVGPQSAGAVPGPACYRRGGPLTITDCQVMLGRLRADTFPAVFGPTGDQPLDAAVVRRRFEETAADVAAATGAPATPQSVAEGFLAIAVDTMAHAIKRISIAKGHDLKDYALVAFGGAAGQHACAVAEALGMATVVVSPLAGVLSAYGIGRAERRSLAHRALERPLEGAGEAITAAVAALEAELIAADGGRTAPGARFERRLRIKAAGSDTTLDIPWTDEVAAAAEFRAAYARRFAFALEGAALVVEAVEVERIVPAADEVRPAPPSEGPARPPRTVPVWMEGAERGAFAADRRALGPGAAIAGPAIVHDATGATVVEPGWTARLAERGDLILTRDATHRRPTRGGEGVDPVRLEVFANLYMAVAEQMGAALESTAVSVNIKERLDFSCAVFDAAGALIANAPHMPVHLGSMGDSVRQVIAVAEARGEPLQPGDAYALNNPYAGGTHLPDITVVMPVFSQTGDRLLFHLAARGHHADVGGVTPGSMPAASRTLAEEGVLLDCLRLVRGGRFDEPALRAALAAGLWPARNPDQNVADLRAQVAACAQGAAAMAMAMEEHGQDEVLAYMDHVQAAAAESVRLLIGRLNDGAWSCQADDGWAVRVALRIDREGRRATVDFTGTDPQLAGNFNAPPSIARAATLYVLRTLIADDIPMNDGCLRPITLINPEGCLLHPQPPAAVVAGNVETSQMVTDALYGAAGAMAAAQGTMNNFTFGDATFQYYETICGGAGAGPDFDGADAVHTHMTNSRMTDPEVIEQRFPVLIDAFAIRRGSGGRGCHRGGDGVVRRVRFLKAMTASILSGRRRVAPFGLAGGAPGAVGVNRIERGDGRSEILPACATAEMGPEDVFVIETPGGGGYGAPEG